MENITLKIILIAVLTFNLYAVQEADYPPGFVGYERQADILGATAEVSPDVLEYIKAHIEKNSRY